MQAAKMATISELVAHLEALTPVAAPIENVHLCAGSWELLFSSITITVRGYPESYSAPPSRLQRERILGLPSTMTIRWDSGG